MLVYHNSARRIRAWIIKPSVLNGAADISYLEVPQPSQSASECEPSLNDRNRISLQILNQNALKYYPPSQSRHGCDIQNSLHSNRWFESGSSSNTEQGQVGCSPFSGIGSLSSEWMYRILTAWLLNVRGENCRSRLVRSSKGTKFDVDRKGESGRLCVA